MLGCCASDEVEWHGTTELVVQFVKPPAEASHHNHCQSGVQYLAVNVVLLYQHNWRSGGQLVAGYVTQLLPVPVDLVAAARVKLPGDIVHEGARRSKQPQRKGNVVDHVARYQWQEDEAAQGRQYRRFVQKVS